MTRLGAFLLRHPRVNRLVHQVLHRKRDEACVVCAAVWRSLEALPGFNEGLRRAEEQLADGGGIRYSADDLRRLD